MTIKETYADMGSKNFKVLDFFFFFFHQIYLVSYFVLFLITFSFAEDFQNSFSQSEN